MNMDHERQALPASMADLRAVATRARASCVQMAHDARHGHLKSALSCMDVLVALYGRFLNVRPETVNASGRDRLLFSKGHAVSALYAVFAEYGFLPPEELLTYARTGARLPDHPCRHVLPLLEICSGSLGYGLGMGTGMIYGMDLTDNPGRVVVLMSDGECNEGSVWEAAMFASAHKMSRLLAIVDNNGLQAVGKSAELMGATSLEQKFAGFGWAVRSVDGNNLDELCVALDGFPFAEDKPSVIIANTKSGAGVSFMENDLVWHYRAPSAEDLARALAELGQTPIQQVQS